MKTEKEIQEAAVNRYGNDPFSFGGQRDGFKEGAKWMQEQDNWISVEDRLPEFEEAVLVWCRIYGRYLATYSRIDNTNCGEWRDFNNKPCLRPVNWQPLPETPKQ